MSGKIFSEEDLKKMFPIRTASELYAKALNRAEVKAQNVRFKLIKPAPIQKQMIRKPFKAGRNEPCPCGSGKKFKKCCLESVS